MSEYQAHIQQGLLANANEASANLKKEILDELAALIYETEFNRYPDDSASDLKKAASRVYEVSEDQILCGSGSDQMLDVIIARYVKPDRPLLTIQPDFSMYDFYCHKLGCSVKKMPAFFRERPDLEKLAETAEEINAGLVLFSNPNNPLGFAFSHEEIEALAKALNPIPLCVDEAYMEFFNDSAIALIENNPNLFVTRTLSKAYALAGLRCGFLISSPENIAEAEKVRTVYNLPSFTQKAAAAVMSHSDEFQADAKKLCQKRDELIEAYNSLDHIEAADSAANYICIKSDLIPEIKKACEEKDIALRFYGEDAPYFRITVLNDENDERIFRVIERCASK